MSRVTVLSERFMDAPASSSGVSSEDDGPVIPKRRVDIRQKMASNKRQKTDAPRRQQEHPDDAEEGESLPERRRRVLFSMTSMAAANEHTDRPPIPIAIPEEEAANNKREEEFRAAGVYDDNYVCELCRIGDAGVSPTSCEKLKKIFQLYEDNRGIKDFRMIYEKMAECYNEEILRNNLKLDGSNPLRLKPWTPTTVRWHYEKCIKKDPTMEIYAQIEMLKWSQSFVRREGLFYKDKSDTTAVDMRKWKVAFQAHNGIVNCLKMLKEFENNKSKGL